MSLQPDAYTIVTADAQTRGRWPRITITRYELRRYDPDLGPYRRKRRDGYQPETVDIALSGSGCPQWLIRRCAALNGERDCPRCGRPLEGHPRGCRRRARSMAPIGEHPIHTAGTCATCHLPVGDVFYTQRATGMTVCEPCFKQREAAGHAYEGTHGLDAAV